MNTRHAYHDTPLDRVAPNLYQGPKPTPGRAYPVDVLVLMAEEYQPRGHNFPGTTVVHAPILDNLWGVTLAEREMIDRTARLVARALRAGKTVLVTCNAGLNRSGVISALALRHVYKMPAEQAIALVRRARGPAALGNHHFIEIIKRS